MDRFSEEKRSEIMSRIRSKDTKAEKIVFKELRKKGIYFQKHYKKAPGVPDIALPRKKKAVFIDGDFWHGYQLEKLKKRLPQGYWTTKIQKNVDRDKAKNDELVKHDWKILRIWEHDVYKNFKETIDSLEKFLIT